MKQITIISGKGGTGKTTLVASFAALAKNTVIADCDVDAPDLHLLLHPEIVKREEFKGLKVAAIDKSKCIECGICEAACRFHAISDNASGVDARDGDFFTGVNASGVDARDGDFFTGVNASGVDARDGDFFTGVNASGVDARDGDFFTGVNASGVDARDGDFFTGVNASGVDARDGDFFTGVTKSGYAVNPARCEGCGVCVFVCDQDAIILTERVSGYAFISKTKYGTMAHAQLNIAEEASGKLVTVVRNNSQRVAEEEGSDLILIDGSPGIGCPVIASLTGVDLALVVTEPTMSGLHDLARILDVTQHFGIASVVCINKYDINEANSRRITGFCQERGVMIVRNIPYDPVVTEAMVAAMPVVEFSDGAVSDAIREIWASIQ
ncbi:MAG: 4Fe-4S binding protein [Methanosarcinales archaeon]|nr:4Fe-4S binding protein [Methanosarcinales archaeon]